jgi:hypothetical protein
MNDTLERSLYLGDLKKFILRLMREPSPIHAILCLDFQP